MTKKLLIIWVSLVCVSLLCNWGILWIQQQDPNSIVLRQPHQTVWCGVLFAWNTLYVVALSISATPLLLNTSKRIRTNKYYRFLSFFLLPLLLIATELTPRLGQPHEIATLYPAFIPFTLCLSIAYLLFSRTLTHKTPRDRDIE